MHTRNSAETVAAKALNRTLRPRALPSCRGDRHRKKILARLFLPVRARKRILTPQNSVCVLGSETNRRANLIVSLLQHNRVQRLNGVPLSPLEYHPHPRYDFSYAREKVPIFFGRNLLGICYSGALVISHRIRSRIVPKCCPAWPRPRRTMNPPAACVLASVSQKKTPGPRTIDAREPGDKSGLSSPLRLVLVLIFVRLFFRRRLLVGLLRRLVRIGFCRGSLSCRRTSRRRLLGFRWLRRGSRRFSRCRALA